MPRGVEWVLSLSYRLRYASSARCVGDYVAYSPARTFLIVTSFAALYLASGSGRSWNLTALLVAPLPPSVCQGAWMA